MVRMIKNASEITDLNKSYIMEFPEEQKKPNKKRKKYDVRLSKITNKDILENSNKRKEKRNGLLQPEVANMQANVEFIKQQIAQSARSKESHKYNKLNPLDSDKAKMANKKKAARERENRKRFGFKNPLYPNKLEMIDYMFAQREARKSEDKLKSRTITKPLINERKQKHINKLYEQMKRKNIDNNMSQSNMRSINDQKAEETGKTR